MAMSKLVTIEEVLGSTPDHQMVVVATDRVTGRLSLVYANQKLVGVFRDPDRARVFASTRRQEGGVVEVDHRLAIPQ